MSTNQSIKPLSTHINSLGHLEIGGCDLVSLAVKYGTPLYVLDEYTIRSICKDYKKSFSAYNNTRLMFASKSLCTVATSKIISDEGFGFDVVSAGEIYTVYKSGTDMSKVIFNGNNKSREELLLAINLGVGRISVDNFYELSLLNQIAEENNVEVDILLRITPGLECHTHEYIQTGHLDSKFGFDLSQIDNAVDIVIRECKNLKLHGLHAHLGSQIFEVSVYGDAIDIIISEMVRIQKKYGIILDEINIGGGLGVRYTETDNPPSTDQIADVIISRLNAAVSEYDINPPVLFIEPGRSIVSTSGVTLYTIGSSKQVPNGTKYVAVDGGMSDNPRPSMYQALYSAVIANKPDVLDALQNVTIAGRFCESGDVLIKNIALPNPSSGDILCVFNTGAYNYSMASNYNRVQKPAMVLVNNSQSDIIVLRETLDDLISHDAVPSRLV